MARDKTFSVLDDVLGDDDETVETIAPEELEPPVEEKIEAEEAIKEEEEKTTPTPKTTKRTTKKPRKKKKPVVNINFGQEDKSVASRTYQMKTEVIEALDSIVEVDGKKIKGSKGFLSTLVNNAVIKELVEMGVMDESYLEELTPYD